MVGMTRVGVVGVGGMGSVHGNQYKKMPDVELWAFDPVAERLQTYADRFGAKQAASLDALIAGCDVVDVCVPTDAHAEIGLKAIAAGRAVFVEKPMERTLEGCEALVNAAAKAGVPLSPGQVVRYFAEYEAAHNLVEHGGLGRPAAARLRRGGKPATGYGNWFQDLERSGGVILDLAIHDYDWLRWTVGEVKTVYARSVRFSPSVAGADFVGDYALTTMTHDSGCVSHCEATWMDPSGFRTTLEVCGSEGMLEFDSRDVATIRTHLADGSRCESNLTPTEDPYYRELRAFIDAVKSGDVVPVTGEDGFKAVAIALAALESAKTGKAVAPAGRV